MEFTMRASKWLVLGAVCYGILAVLGVAWAIPKGVVMASGGSVVCFMGAIVFRHFEVNEKTETEK